MNIISEVSAIIKTLNIPIDVGKFKNNPPPEYVVLTPMSDDFDVFADNAPEYEVQSLRISLYTKQNYRRRKNQITKALMDNDITVSNRRFIEFEGDTKYYHYNIDAEKEYFLQEEN